MPEFFEDFIWACSIPNLVDKCLLAGSPFLKSLCQFDPNIHRTEIQKLSWSQISRIFETKKCGKPLWIDTENNYSRLLPLKKRDGNAEDHLVLLILQLLSGNRAPPWQILPATMQSGMDQKPTASRNSTDKRPREVEAINCDVTETVVRKR